MTNPDRDELVKLAGELQDRALCAVEYVARLNDSSREHEAKQWIRRTYDRLESALRRLASSDGGVKGEPEPVAWPANLNPRTLDLVQRFALALAKKLRLAEEKYGHTDGWLRDDWEAECRDHLYQHLEKGDPRDVAAYCAFMWHHGWITYRPEPVASKRPVAFRVRQHRLSNYYELYTDEKDAQFWADDRGVDYEGLYLVADRYLAPPADAGMRPTTEDILERINTELSTMAESWVGAFSGLSDGDDVAEYLTGTVWANLATAIDALTAPGATTKSDGGQPIHAIKMSEYHYQELDMSGDHHGVTSNYSEYTPVTVRGSTSDPSSTRSDVAVDDLVDVMIDAGLLFDDEHEAARALLDQFEIRRK